MMLASRRATIHSMREDPMDWLDWGLIPVTPLLAASVLLLLRSPCCGCHIWPGPQHPASPASRNVGGKRYEQCEIQHNRDPHCVAASSCLRIQSSSYDWATCISHDTDIKNLLCNKNLGKTLGSREFAHTIHNHTADLRHREQSLAAPASQPAERATRSAHRRGLTYHLSPITLHSCFLQDAAIRPLFLLSDSIL